MTGSIHRLDQLSFISDLSPLQPMPYLFFSLQHSIKAEPPTVTGARQARSKTGGKPGKCQLLPRGAPGAEYAKFPIDPSHPDILLATHTPW